MSIPTKFWILHIRKVTGTVATREVYYTPSEVISVVDIPVVEEVAPAPAPAPEPAPEPVAEPEPQAEPEAEPVVEATE